MADDARAADKLPEALRLYQEAVHQRPSWSEGWWWLASIYYEQDRFGEAQKAFVRFIATTKNPAPAYAFLGLCEYETGDYGQALKHFTMWAQRGSPGNAQLIDVASFHWALLLTRDGQFVPALYLLEEKIKRHGALVGVVEAMGLAALRMKAVPEDYPAEKREMAWLAGKAMTYASLRDFERAQEFAGRLVSHYGNEPNVHFLRGDLFLFDKRNDEAAAEFKRELEISPEHVQAMSQLALVDLEFEKAEEAVVMARRAASLASGDALAHFALGRSLFATGDLQGSAREFERARQLAPYNAKVRFHLAKTYRKLGRVADAERESAAFESLKGKDEFLPNPGGDRAKPAGGGQKK